MDMKKRRFVSGLVMLSGCFFSKSAFSFINDSKNKLPKCKDISISDSSWNGMANANSLQLHSCERHCDHHISVAEDVAISNEYIPLGLGLKYEKVDDGFSTTLVVAPIQLNFNIGENKVRYTPGSGSSTEKNQNLTVNSTSVSENQITLVISTNKNNDGLFFQYGVYKDNLEVKFSEENINKLFQFEKLYVSVLYNSKRVYTRKHYTKGFKNLLAQLREFQKSEHKRMVSQQCTTDCFITTATCKIVGLEDDCWELATLRSFRDSYMSTILQGAADISAYYHYAPKIIDKINREHGAKHIYLRLYWFYIFPSAVLATFGLNKLTYAHYKKMMQTLITHYAD